MLAHADVKERHMTKLTRYKKNLRIDGDQVISYTTCVAIIDLEAGTIRELGTWSRTTTKHVNYVASELGLKKV
jgi:hypothetical protein